MTVSRRVQHIYEAIGALAEDFSEAHHKSERSKSEVIHSAFFMGALSIIRASLKDVSTGVADTTVNDLID